MTNEVTCSSCGNIFPENSQSYLTILEEGVCVSCSYIENETSYDQLLSKAEAFVDRWSQYTTTGTPLDEALDIIREFIANE